MANYILFIVNLILLILATSDGRFVRMKNQCRYDGDMSKIDMKQCLTRIHRSRRRRECSSYDITYGKTLYDNREDTIFWLVFHDKDKYAKTLTYRITREKGETLTSIDSCRSVKLNGNCTLPKKNHRNEQDYVFIPFADERDGYCLYPLYERIGYYPWCESSGQTECKRIHRGKLCLHHTFIPLSFHSSSCRHRVDYCFFEIDPQEVDVESFRQGSGLFKVDEIKKGNGDGEYLMRGETHRCDLKLGIRNLNMLEKLRNTSNPESIGCVFTKTHSENRWDPNPMCY